jgi:hypothetical protein
MRSSAATRHGDDEGRRAEDGQQKGDHGAPSQHGDL